MYNKLEQLKQNRTTLLQQSLPLPNTSAHQLVPLEKQFEVLPSELEEFTEEELETLSMLRETLYKLHLLLYLRLFQSDLPSEFNSFRVGMLLNLEFLFECMKLIILLF